MKITRRQLRKIIREATMMGRAPMGALPSQKMYKAIVDILPVRGGGMSPSELVDSVNQMHPEIAAEVIYDFLDELQADGELKYDESMDEWSLA